ncbi:MAG: MoxR family ATPase [Proteobacteria bacterium]|nr:MoxR family ATPase [Pseudomonadota bacterium]
MLLKTKNNKNTPIDSIIDAIGTKIFDKSQKIKLALAGLLTGGHVLIEDKPGLGKTTLALTIAQAFGMDFKRIQFTSDMMPSDVLGVTIYDKDKHEFEYHKGPIFTQFLLADELNRATPKTQSALLEAMAENQVSIDGKTYQLDDGFFVVATQNPLDDSGTYLLPYSQLDRFILSMSLGYPSTVSERNLYTEDFLKNMAKPLKQQSSVQSLLKWQDQVQTIYASDEVLDYLQSLVEKTRNHAEISHGLSPRAGLALFKLSQSLAFIAGRDFMIPEDVQEAFYPVSRHRLICNEVTTNCNHLIHSIIDDTPIL